MIENQKLYMQWWFWVIIGFMFVTVILVIAPYPDEETEHQLIECQESLNEWEDLWQESLNEWEDLWGDYEEAMYEYCELDPTNLLCENYQ
ncbi:hypothetical protein LCGC14_2391710 [marine sediment metagenome]|uniref:Uncharacterized protein n=1 Tax=marine sediment metagenome TaxID=412755 RepID=A0A0F9BY43_9ZZZZ